jgi:hypothetical protein
VSDHGPLLASGEALRLRSVEVVDVVVLFIAAPFTSMCSSLVESVSVGTSVPTDFEMETSAP